MMTANQDQHPVRVGSLEVSAFRYSKDPRAVAAFLEVLGLSPRVSNEEGSWLELQAAAGSVSLHAIGAAGNPDAESGKTDLVLIVRDVPAFAAGLADQEGVEVSVWDEAFGHQAVVNVGERKIIINEIQPDPYGYQLYDPTPGPVTVVTHCSTADFDGAQELFAALGFRAASQTAGGHPVRLESTDVAGVIVLHRGDAGADRYAVGFEIAEDLTAVVGRLRDAGYRPRSASGGQQVEVTDPDGQSVTITAR
ncbi:MAG TPA: hypothetical protein VIP98_01305 [Microlunatus sp.]